MISRWIVCEDGGEYHVVQVHGRETQKLFLVTEKDNPNGKHWSLIKSCLRYRTRVDKNDPRLFSLRHDAIDATINRLQAAREDHLKKAEEILEHVRKLREMR